MAEADNNISEDLLCPVCLHLPENIIYQCRNGHSICGKCCQGAKVCPHCRVSYKEGVVRNRTMESFISTMMCPCPYKSSGCTEILKGGDLPSHKKACKFGGMWIQFCKLLGYKCDFWVSPFGHNTTINPHFTNTHRLVQCSAGKGQIKLYNFMGGFVSNAENTSRLKNSMWTPVLIDFKCSLPTIESSDADADNDSWLTDSDSSADETTFRKFFIFSRVHAQDKTISWACVYVGDSKEAQQFVIQFKIKSCSEKVPDLKWTVPSVGILQGELFSWQASPFRVPIKLLKEKYIRAQDKDLTVDFQLQKIGERQKQEGNATIWTLNFDPQGADVVCQECSQVITKSLYKCTNCPLPYYICDQCILAGANVESHDLKLVHGFENDGHQADATGARSTAAGASQESEEFPLNCRPT